MCVSVGQGARATVWRAERSSRRQETEEYILSELLLLVVCLQIAWWRLWRLAKHLTFTSQRMRMSNSEQQPSSLWSRRQAAPTLCWQDCQLDTTIRQVKMNWRHRQLWKFSTVFGTTIITGDCFASKWRQIVWPADKISTSPTTSTSITLQADKSRYYWHKTKCQANSCNINTVMENQQIGIELDLSVLK